MSSCSCDVVDRISFMSPVHSVLCWVDVLVVCHMSSLQYRKIWHTVSLQYALISCLSSYCYYLSSTFQSWAQFLSFITPSAAILPPPHPPAPPPQQPGWYVPRQKNKLNTTEGRATREGERGRAAMHSVIFLNDDDRCGGACEGGGTNRCEVGFWPSWLVFCPTNWHMIARHGQLCWKDEMLTAVIV